jgi:hypothetical protein|tara:strand:- start:408 stop:674 length:267 start_codon:yes stop_codon:yes gene_type:complete
MIKNFLSVVIFLFSVAFIYTIGNIYFSDNQASKTKKNRQEITNKIKKSHVGLPVLSNDTNSVIIFNSGFDDESEKIERSFWKLFKSND